MWKRYRKHFIGLGAFILFFTFVVPVLFGTPRVIKDQTGGDPWRNIIFDFQTLVTGLLAVGAASWTVMTMERTDREAERRHQELVKLSLRADRLRVERMLMPAASELREKYVAISIFDIAAMQSVPYDPWPAVARLRDLTIALDGASLILGRAVFSDAQDLFDGELAEQYSKLRNRLRDCATEVERCIGRHTSLAVGIKNEYPDTIAEQSSKIGELLVAIETGWNECLRTFDELLTSLDDMQREYGIHPSSP